MGIVNRLACLVLISSVFYTIGCEKETPDSQSRSNKFSPQQGRYCAVQFRRDALGASADLPVPPTTSSINGADVSVSGKFSKMNEDWVVLTDSRDAEIWIPRSVILLIKVNP